MKPPAKHTAAVGGGPRRAVGCTCSPWLGRSLALPRSLPVVQRAARPCAHATGFTLLEVVLALSIAFGLLVVVLFYYQQAALLRDSTLGSAAGLAAVRLCMDRLSTELRTASAQPDTFRGGPQDLEFLQCDLPEPASGLATDIAAEAPAPFPLRRIRYALPDGGGDAAGPALVRTETAVTPAMPAAPNAEAPPEPRDPVDTNDVWAVETTTPAETGTRVTTSFPSAGTAALTIPELRYLRLRYWDGAAWQESWSNPSLPRGVEVTLALEAVPADAAPDALPGEVFRRVIAVPAGLATTPSAGPGGDSEEGNGDPVGWTAREGGL